MINTITIQPDAALTNTAVMVKITEINIALRRGEKVVIVMDSTIPQPVFTSRIYSEYAFSTQVVSGIRIITLPVQKIS